LKKAKNNKFGPEKAKTGNPDLHGKARKTYFEKFLNSKAVDAITDETSSSQIATRWTFLRDYCVCLYNSYFPFVYNIVFTFVSVVLNHFVFLILASIIFVFPVFFFFVWFYYYQPPLGTKI